QQLDRMRYWLSAPDPSPNYQKALKEHHPDNGHWFLRSQKYENWKSEAASIMWLHGIPGCGKTILSSGVIKDISESSEEYLDSHSPVTVYFFFDFKDPRKHSSDLMLKSLITQLLQSPHAPHLELISSMYSSCGLGNRQPTTDEMMSVLHRIIETSKHAFRWAVCQLDSLGNCMSRFELRECLTTLPSTLDETYNRILRSIDDKRLDYALRILKWLAFAARPLDVKEVAEAAAIDPTCSPAFDPDKVLEDPFDVLTICSSLITISGGSEQEVALAHYSVKEYLTSSRILNSIVQQLLKGTEVDLNHTCRIRHSLYFTPLHVGAYYGHSGVVKQLLDAHAPINTRTRLSSETALILALKKKHLEVAKLLLAAGAEVHHCDNEGSNALLEASSAGYYDIVKSLLAVGEDINHRDSDGCQALHMAARRGHYEVVELLLEAEAPLDSLNRRGDGALYLAYKGQHERVVQTLLSAGADKSYALVSAARRGNRQPVKQLLDAGANADAISPGYGTALQFAAYHGEETMVQQLLDAGAKVNSNVPVGEHQRTTALIAALEGGRYGVVQQLINAGANVNQMGTCTSVLGCGIVPATWRGHKETVERLLRAGADVNEVAWKLLPRAYAYGAALIPMTPLQAAAGGPHGELVQLLLDAKADVNTVFGTPLATAAGRGRQHIVQQLIEAGADVNQLAWKWHRRRDAWALATPAWHATNKRDKSVANLLSDYGAQRELLAQVDKKSFEERFRFGKAISDLSQTAWNDSESVRSTMWLYLRVAFHWCGRPSWEVG
ncbi:ankyrin repeat-containing domain protein, partial [Lineolata rhizophorae]